MIEFLIGLVLAVFSLAQAPSQSIRGLIATSSGSIFRTSRLATQSSALDTQIIQQGETIIASDGGRVEIHFGDNKVSLDPETEMEIVQTLPGKFVFNQKNGTVYYQIDGSVTADHLLTDIKGTARVQINDNIINVSSITGQVKAGYNDLNYNSIVKDLKNSFTFDNNRRN